MACPNNTCTALLTKGELIDAFKGYPTKSDIDAFWLITNGQIGVSLCIAMRAAVRVVVVVVVVTVARLTLNCGSLPHANRLLPA